MDTGIIIMTARDDEDDEWTIPPAFGVDTSISRPDAEPFDPIAMVKRTRLPPSISLDELPAPDHAFGTPEAAIAFAESWAKERGYGLRQSNKVYSKKNAAIIQQTLICSRAGAPPARATLRERDSDRYRCPFKFKIHYAEDINTW